MSRIFLGTLLLLAIARSAYCTASCVEGFIGHSDRCFRRIATPKSWADAKSYCESQEEELVVLDSLELINWFRNMMQTMPGWNSGDMWLGGKRLAGKWRWASRSNSKLIDYADWEQVQPDGGDNYCVQIFDNNRYQASQPFENYKWDDAPCANQKKFVCSYDASSNKEHP